LAVSNPCSLKYLTMFEMASRLSVSTWSAVVGTAREPSAAGSAPGRLEGGERLTPHGLVVE